MTSPSPSPFASLTALAAEHTALLRLFANEDDTRLSAPFIQRVEEFMARAVVTGTVLDYSEERSEAQTYLTYWTTVLFTSDRRARAMTLAPFDSSHTRAAGGGCPYRGFRSFAIPDSPVFFGRRNLIAKLVSELGRRRFVSVVGISGSGKSSLVRAGLIPTLKEGGLPDSATWRYPDPFMPGADPLAALAKAVNQILAGGPESLTKEQLAASSTCLYEVLVRRKTPALLVIDQFEELFTLGAPKDQQDALAANLAHAVADAESGLYVVTTMRGEYDSVIAKSEALEPLFESGRFTIPPLRANELREAIERPALREGIHFAPGLVDQLIQSVLGEPAGLPLLEFTLMKLWENRTGDVIERSTYERLGGSPEKILAQTADQLYSGLDPEDRNAFREIFLNLIQLGEGLQITRRWATRESLRQIDEPDRVDRLIRRLEEEGFVQVTKADRNSDDHVEIVHEALTQKWPMLQTWLLEDLARLQQRKLLKENARQFKNDPGSVTLYVGRQLEDAMRLKPLSPEERIFLKASRQASAQAAFHVRLLKIAGTAVVLSIIFGLWGGNHYYKGLAADNAKQAGDLRILNQQLIDQNRLKAENRRCAVAQNTLQENFLTSRSTVDEIVKKNPNKVLPTIYVQYIDSDAKPAADQFVAKLRDGGYLAPGTQYVPMKEPFSGIRLRYFHPGEAAEASSIADGLKSLGKVTPAYTKGYEEKVNPHTFEIWIGDKAQQSPVQEEKGKAKAN